MSIADMLDRSLTIERATVSASTAGSAQRTFNAVASSVAFSVAPSTDRVIDAYARRNLVVDYTLWTNADLRSLIPADSTHGPGVALKDRVRDLVSGEIFIVQGKKYYGNANVSDETLWELHCETVDTVPLT